MDPQLHDKQATKPKDYKPIPYNPAKTVDTEDKLKELPQTSLEHSYTFWIKIID